MQNRFQKEELLKERESISHYLKNSLTNDNISLTITVEERSNKSEKIYTSADKYNDMIKQNPALKKLKEQFNLDLD
ncbi:hypothetical protein QA597_06360 [Marinilabiliaceae bacterium ANBcel2]|nr:hypothetical protein [Marinilabiliaceae bacterium ANBcel2]